MLSALLREVKNNGSNVLYSSLETVLSLHRVTTRGRQRT